MLIGNPDKFAFLIEVVPEWSTDRFANGLFYIYLNGVQYPNEVRTTTINVELYELLSKDSPFIRPQDDALFSLNTPELFNILWERTFPEEGNNDYRFLVPLHEMSDAGFVLFVVSSGEKVRLLLGRGKGTEKGTFIDETTIERTEHTGILQQLQDYRQKLSGEISSN